MLPKYRFAVGLGFLLCLAFAVPVLAPPSPTSKFDGFGDINCEDEFAHLDNFAIQLQREPTSRGIIIFYGGQTFRGRLPKRGEAAVRAGRMKPYLANQRGISRERVIVIDGGFRETWGAELWILPPGASTPTPTPTVTTNEVRFGKGKPKSRDFSCGI